MGPPTAGKDEQGAGGGAGDGAVGQLKKGPWTLAEDAILVDYVNKYEEGNWNSVQKNSGLQRCGKSCRLRWANHLRPHLKKGPFSPDEEMRILRLHAELGNKWARISTHLPGRTDNEIKNYWNTRIKRRQRAGMPLYPLEIQHQMARRGMQGVAVPAMSNLVPAPATPELMEGKPYFSAAAAVAQTPLPNFNSSAALLSPNPFGSIHQNPSPVRNISFHPQLSSVSPPASSLFHNSPSPSQFGLGSFELSPPPPPLHSPSYSVKMELPSSQLFSVSGEANSGLLDALVQDVHGTGDLPKDDQLLPPLPLATYSSLAPLSCSRSFAMDPLCKFGGCDCSIGIQVKKEVNHDVATLLDMILMQTSAPLLAQAKPRRLADCYNNSHGCGGEFFNNPSSSVIDDYIGVEMQQQLASTLIMPGEHD